jgi:Concanavalin A-like lectin/glucanases superfamily
MSSRISFSSRWAGAITALACVMLAAPAAASATSYNDAVLADGPLVYYELNGNANDASGNGVNGTATNATFGVSSPFTGAVTAVQFAGDGSITAPALGGQTHTAELWVKPTARSQMDLVTHGDPSADGWSVAIGAKRKLVFQTAGRTITSRLPIGVGRWSMIDVTWTSTSVSFAINGGQTQFKTKPLPVASPGPGSPAQLTVADGVKGSIDEVALYPAALTRSQIAAHFVATGLPVNTAAPVVDGVPRVGQTLTLTQGTWIAGVGSPTDQWQQCDPTTGDCTDISGATGSTFQLTSSQLGKQIQVVETESNLVGSSSAISNQTAAVVDVSPIGGPVVVTPPTISGTAVQGQTLTADPGTWDDGGSALDFGYQWQRCDVDGANCSPIVGATSQAYVLGAADLGSTVDVVVTADDHTHPPATAESDATAVVTASSTGAGSGGSDSGAGAAGAVLGSHVVCPAHIANLPKRVSKRHRGFGSVGLRFSRGSGKTALKAVLALRTRNVRSVEFRLDGKRVKRLRRSPFRVSVSRARLKPGATQTLTITVSPKHGSKFSLKVRLHVAACS